MNNHWHQDLQRAIVEAQEWTPIFHPSLSDDCPGIIDRALPSLGWNKPPYVYVKCNFDCRYRADGKSIGAWIIRDANGFFMEVGQSVGGLCSSALEAELHALLMAMQQTWICEYRCVFFKEIIKKFIHCLQKKSYILECIIGFAISKLGAQSLIKLIFFRRRMWE